MTARQTNSIAYETFKQSASDLVRACGGLKVAASATRVTLNSISRYANSSIDAAHMPVDIVYDLEQASGELVVTEALARLHGCALVRTEKPDIAHDNFVGHISNLTSEFADVTANVAHCLADDNKISKAEIKATDLRREIHELVQAALELDLALEQIEMGKHDQRLPTKDVAMRSQRNEREADSDQYGFSAC